MASAIVAAAVLAPCGGGVAQDTAGVEAILETTPVPEDGADDPAVWIHPTDPAQSIILGTDKQAGLAVYDLAGTEIQFLPAGRLNNVDVRYGFPLGGQAVDIVAASNRTDNTIDLFKIDPATRQLVDVASGELPIGIGEPYGIALYHSCSTGVFYVIVSDTDGEVEQYELVDDGRGLIDTLLVRSFSVGSITEGIVADDENGVLYVGEETEGIWRYDAEPDAGDDRVLVDTTGPGGHLTADVEGLTIYHASDGGGYLIASSQGSDDFVVYERTGRNEYLMRFQVVDGPVDGCSATDGIDVTNVALGGLFPDGLFVAHDDSNPGANQNYKVVDWREIAHAGPLELVIDTTWNPRACLEACPWDIAPPRGVGIADLLALFAAWGTNPAGPPDFNGDGIVGVADMLILLANWGPCP